MYVPEVLLSQRLQDCLQESLGSEHLEESVKQELSKLLRIPEPQNSNSNNSNSNNSNSNNSNSNNSNSNNSNSNNSHSNNSNSNNSNSNNSNSNNSNSNSNNGDNNKDQKVEKSRGIIVPVKLVKISIEALNKARAVPIYIHEVMKDSELYLQEYKPPQRSVELETRIQRLKKEADDREYRQMTRNVHRTKKIVDGNIGKELKAMNLQIIAVVNFVLTVGGAFAFGYKATEASMEVPDMAIQMLVGFVLGTVVFFADLYFLVKRTM